MADNSVTQFFHDRTGRNGLAGCRAGFADYDAFGAGFIARDTWSGCLDAPDFMPQGSVRKHNTIRKVPALSLANRDRLTGHASIGTAHDGPEAPELYDFD